MSNVIMDYRVIMDLMRDAIISDLPESSSGITLHIEYHAVARNVGFWLESWDTGTGHHRSYIHYYKLGGNAFDLFKVAKTLWLDFQNEKTIVEEREIIE